MNVYFDTHRTNWAFYRVIKALYDHPHPHIEAVEDERMADLVVYHVVGRCNHIQRYAAETTAQGKQYAIIQYALRSTRNPSAADWLSVWKGAKVVWSYYDLPTCIAADGLPEQQFNFYHSPLGVDPNIFYLMELDRKYLLITTGSTYEAECIGECFTAANRVSGRIGHLGKGWNYQEHVDYYPGLYDIELRQLYNRGHYVSALRRKEGFELPAIEGLLCGARPIMFDRPNARQWFDGLVEFIPEQGPEQVTDSLVKIFRQTLRPVTDTEWAETIRRFDWQKIVTGFWEQCL